MANSQKNSGISSWFNALLGRSKVDVKKMEAAVERPKEDIQVPAKPQVAKVPEVSATSQEDSIKTDFKNFALFLSKLVSRSSSVLGPIASNQSQKVSKKLGNLSSSNKMNFKKIIKILIIISFLIILALLGSRVFKKVAELNDQTKPQPTTMETPTPAVFQPYKPSEYADDPEVLKLEEDVNILERELARTGIKEDRLYPPQLEFKVDFKD